MNQICGLLARGAAVGFLALSVGCGSGDGGTVAVGGTVTYKGQPVANATVTFTPAQGRPASGTTDAQGKFKLTTNRAGDGGTPGANKVTLTPGPDTTPPPMPGTPEAANYKAPPPPFPTKYSSVQTTDLTASVEKGKKNDFPFELKD